MRGLGPIGDLAILALAVLSMLGWLYLWYLCVFGAEKVLSRLFGGYALGISAIGFPFVACFVLALALKAFGRHNLGFAMLTFGLGLPVLGILYLRAEMKGR